MKDSKNKTRAFIAIGANLPHAQAPALETCKRIVALFKDSSLITRLRCSRWYRSAPIPPSAQPDYINGIVYVETPLAARDLLNYLQTLEKDFGRERSVVNAPRTLDLDIIAVAGFMCHEEELMVPHPRMCQRLFVLLPLYDLDPTWRHPLTGTGIKRLIESNEEQAITPIA